MANLVTQIMIVADTEIVRIEMADQTARTGYVTHADVVLTREQAEKFATMIREELDKTSVGEGQNLPVPERWLTAAATSERDLVKSFPATIPHA